MMPHPLDDRGPTAPNPVPRQVYAAARRILDLSEEPPWNCPDAAAVWRYGIPASGETTADVARRVVDLARRGGVV
jgi:hypothetical protein